MFRPPPRSCTDSFNSLGNSPSSRRRGCARRRCFVPSAGQSDRQHAAGSDGRAAAVVEGGRPTGPRALPPRRKGNPEGPVERINTAGRRAQPDRSSLKGPTRQHRVGTQVGDPCVVVKDCDTGWVVETEPIKTVGQGAIPGLIPFLQGLTRTNPDAQFPLRFPRRRRVRRRRFFRTHVGRHAAPPPPFPPLPMSTPNPQHTNYPNPPTGH